MNELNKPCDICKCKFSLCAITNECAAQAQCLGCIFWHGTNSMYPNYCEMLEIAPDNECKLRLVYEDK